MEASPAPVSYWLKGGRLPHGFTGNMNSAEIGQPRPEMLLDGPKYGITEQRNGYKGVMRLTIRSFSSSDVGTYHCVSTNSLGRAEGTLRLYGKNDIILNDENQSMNGNLISQNKFIC